MKNEIILYQSGELAEHIEVRLDEDTVWLNRNQIATLFGRDVKTIGKHINNVFLEGEIIKDSSVANFAAVQMEGGRKIERKIEYYNLDVIIFVGFRAWIVRKYKPNFELLTVLRGFLGDDITSLLKYLG